VGLVAAGLVAALGLTIARPARSGALVDNQAPQVVALSLSRTSVDASAGPADVVVDARITDAVGLSIGGDVPLTRFVLTGPGGQQRATAYVSRAQLVSGGAADGTYRTTVTVPWHAEPGRWTATFVLYDSVGNTATMNAAALAGAGLPSGIDQTGPGDTTPPQLAALSVSPTTIDTALAPATLTVTARVVDDLAGVSDGVGVAASQVVFRGPSGAHRVRATLDVRNRIGSNPLDASFVVAMTVPRWAEQGVWTVEAVNLVDEVGNTAAVAVPSVTFTQNGIGDITPPTLRTFSIDPGSVDVRNAGATVTLQARVTDDRSGVADTFGTIVFRSPSGHQELSASVGTGQRIFGNVVDGVYRVSLAVPTSAENGTWTLRVAQLVDAATNVAAPSGTDLATLGFPSTFTVVSNVDPGSVVTVPNSSTVPPTSPSTLTFATTTSTSSPSPTTVPSSVITGSSTSTTSTTSTSVSSTTSTTDASNSTTSSTTPGTTPDDPLGSTSTTTTIDTTTTPTTSDPSTTTSTTTATTTTTVPTGPFGTTTTSTTVPVGSTSKPLPVTGYWFATATGQVAGFGTARTTSVQSAGFDAQSGFTVGIAPTRSGKGYWLASYNGDVRGVGDARVLGSLRGRVLKKPIVGIASTVSGRGYWLVASDGGIFAFGDARFYGSTGALRLKQPIVGMAPTPTGRGYWLVASDGGIFTFGDGRFYGSTGALRLKKPVVGMAALPSGRGYWMVASDGGIFTFGDGRFYGSTGAMRLTKPIAGMATTASAKGYWLVGADGGVFAFGDAKYLGSFRSPYPVVGMAVRF
jgi:hypothetical protein